MYAPPSGNKMFAVSIWEEVSTKNNCYFAGAVIAGVLMALIQSKDVIIRGPLTKKNSH